MIALANQYVDFQKPWELKNSDPKRMQDILFILTEQIFKITKCLYPVIPTSAEKLLNQIGAPYELRLTQNEAIPADVIVLNDVEPLFPRIEDVTNLDVYAE